MAGTYLHPTAGYIVDAGYNAPIAPLGPDDKTYLRQLAKQVREIASLPVQQTRRDGWTAHNDLASAHPMYVCYMEDGWGDLIPLDSLRLPPGQWANCEWYLKHLLYRHQHIDDDFVTEPEIAFSVAHTIHNADYGLPGHTERRDESGAWMHEPPMDSYALLPKLVHPHLEVDERETAQRLAMMQDVFGDILSVYGYLTAAFTANQPGKAAELRGIEQIMWDMYDEPDELHQLMDFLTQGYIKLFCEMEQSGYLRPNNRNQYIDAGGNGYTTQLHPAQNGPCKLKDLWGYAVAQEFSSVSPEMHEEFGIRYQARVMELFGMCAYGCCEPYTHKFDILQGLPRLRRVSVSPWCDVEVAAQKLKRDIVFSWKPNPSTVLYTDDRDAVRAYVRKTLETAQGCALEIFLKDIIHLREGLAPRALGFGRMLREEISRLYGR